MKFDSIAEMISGIIKNGIDICCTDVGEIEFHITYSDKSKFKEIYWATGDSFKELFGVIKQIVPDCEDIPAVLLTSEDYEDEEKDE